MDEALNEKVLLACKLKKDIALFPFGDAMVFFQRSINLRGGQKHRVQPARALFQEASVYFFDDPITVVEAHTGFHLLKATVKHEKFWMSFFLKAFDPPFEMDAGIGSDFDEPSPVDRKVTDKIKHAHEGINCCGRDDENIIELQSYPSPTRDPAFTSLNSNERQAIESTDKDTTTDLPTPELNGFGTRGPVCSCDNWSCTRSEAQAKEHYTKPRANGSACRIPDDSEDGHPIGSPKHMPYDHVPLDLGHPSFQLRVPSADVDKVRCIIRNIVRDWGEEGALEREQCYLPILEELHRLFPDWKDLRQRPTCLVPRAGLGRLAYEISRLGFIAQGNEFSYYMLMCSSFILNQSDEAFEWALHPWIHSNCNNLSDSDQLRAVFIPDLHLGSAGITEGFSMCAGDFVEVYSHPSQAGTNFTLKKHSNHRGGLVDRVLHVRSASLVKIVNIGHRQKRRRMKGAKRVNLKKIVKLETLSDDEHIVLVYLASRVMRLSIKDSLSFLLAVQRNMKSNLKLDIEMEKATSYAIIENVAAYLRKGLSDLSSVSQGSDGG